MFFARRIKTGRAVASQFSGLVAEWSAPTQAPLTVPKVWKPKNQEIICPKLRREVVLPWAQWQASGFPSFGAPGSVKTHVNIDYWFEELSRVQEAGNTAASLLMNTVLTQLTSGADSRVGSPGVAATTSENYFPAPEVDIPRMMDALASEIKSEHMAGPIHPSAVTDVKINGFMAVPKPSGDRRQVYLLPESRVLTHDTFPGGKHVLSQGRLIQRGGARLFAKRVEGGADVCQQFL